MTIDHTFVIDNTSASGGFTGIPAPENCPGREYVFTITVPNISVTLNQNVNRKGTNTNTLSTGANAKTVKIASVRWNASGTNYHWRVISEMEW